MSPDSGDPTTWSVDQVVDALCSPSGRLQNSERGRKKAYDFKSLENTLRDNEIDGNDFLNSIDNETILQVLGVNSFSQRVGILEVQRQLREESESFQSGKLAEQEKDVVPDAQVTLISKVVRKELKELKDVLQTYSSNSVSGKEQNKAASVTSDIDGTFLAEHVPSNKGPSEPQNTTGTVNQSNEPPNNALSKPKKRLSPGMFLSLDDSSKTDSAPQATPIDQLFFGTTVLGNAIQHGVPLSEYEVRAMSGDSYPMQQTPSVQMSYVHVGQRSSSTSRWVNKKMKYFLSQEVRTFRNGNHVRLGLQPYHSRLAILGQPSMTLVTNLGRSTQAIRVSSAAWEETDEVESPTKSWIPEEIAYLNNHQQLGSDNSEVGDIPIETLDPHQEAFFDHLQARYKPALVSEEPGLAVEFDSDSEDLDEETWADMQDEANETASPKYLSGDSLSRSLKQVKAEKRDEWKERRLPKLETKAFKIWSKARASSAFRNGTLQALEQRIAYYETRLAKLEAEICLSQYKSLEDLRKQCSSLDVTLWDLCDFRWRKDIVLQKDPPPKIIAPKPTEKSGRPTKAIDSDGEDLNNSDDDLEDFVVPDAIPPESDKMEVENIQGDDIEIDPISPQPQTTDQPGDDATQIEESLPVLHASEATTEVEVVDATPEPTSTMEPVSNSRDNSVGDESDGSATTSPSHALEPRLDEPSTDLDSDPVDFVDLTMVESESDDDSDSVTRQVGHEASMHIKAEGAEKSVGTPVPAQIPEQLGAEKSAGSSVPAQIPEQLMTLDPDAPVWKEPPKAPPPPRPSQPSKIISLEDDSDIEAPKIPSSSASKLLNGTQDELPAHLDIGRIREMTVLEVDATENPKVVMAWTMINMPDGIKEFYREYQGQSEHQLQIGLWRALHHVYDHGSSADIKDEDVTIGALHAASWFICYIDGKVADRAKGFKTQSVEQALESFDKYEDFYEVVQDIILAFHEHNATNPAQKLLKPSWEKLLTPSSKKRQVLTRSSSEEERRTQSGRKKRKYQVQESQTAKQKRAKAQDRQEMFKERQELVKARDSDRNAASSSLDQTPVINIEHGEDEDEITLNRQIGERIFPHQIDGIRFLYREVVSADDQQGCLLAHPMGMGKTMQVIALLATIAEAVENENPRVRNQIPEKIQSLHFLILCPPTLVNNWYDELTKWVPDTCARLRGENIFKIDSTLEKDQRLELINEHWAEKGGILLMASTAFRDLVRNRQTKAMGLDGEPRVLLDEGEHAQIRESLLKLPVLVIYDEAQEIKGEKSKLALAAHEIETQSRIALTGSPLANNVEEYYRIINWVALDFLGDAREFRAKFAEPISESMYVDASSNDKRQGLKMLSILKDEIAPKVHRTELSALSTKLPSKTEFIIKVPLTVTQEKCYSKLVRSILDGNGDPTTTPRARIWAYLSILRLLCSHPLCFQHNLASIKAGKVTETRPAVNEDDQVASRLEAESQDLVQNPAKHLLDPSMVAEQLADLGNIQTLSQSIHSNKMEVLKRILQSTLQTKDDKILVFSHSLPTLDYVQKMIEDDLGSSCHRLDGTTVVKKRQQLTKDFNDGKVGHRIFIISTRAGGTGLNLFGANRVVILDETFNPMYEKQAIGRSYRIGQKKNVYVYRLIVGKTFEDAMQNLANFKIGVAERVVDQKDTVRSASKGLREWVFMPQTLDQEDISTLKGKDTEVLDKLIETEGDHPRIRSIVLGDSLFAEEKEDLTEQELKEVAEERRLRTLRKKDPIGYEMEMRRSAAEREKNHRGVTMPGTHMQFHMGPYSPYAIATPNGPSQGPSRATVPPFDPSQHMIKDIQHLRVNQGMISSPSRVGQSGNAASPGAVINASSTTNILQPQPGMGTPTDTLATNASHGPQMAPIMRPGSVLDQHANFTVESPPSSEEQSTSRSVVSPNFRNESKGSFKKHLHERVEEMKFQGSLPDDLLSAAIDRVVRKGEAIIHKDAKDEKEYRERMYMKFMMTDTKRLRAILAQSIRTVQHQQSDISRLNGTPDSFLATAPSHPLLNERDSSRGNGAFPSTATGTGPENAIDVSSEEGDDDTTPAQNAAHDTPSNDRCAQQ